MKKKFLLYISCLLLLFVNLFAEQKKTDIPSFFGVELGSSTSEAIRTLTKCGFALLGDNDCSLIFVSRDGSAKFGEQPIGALAINYNNDTCVTISYMFSNNQLSSIKYRKAVQEYLKQFADVESISIDENNKSENGGFFSCWIVSGKYVVYSREETGDTTGIIITYREMTRL